MIKNDKGNIEIRGEKRIVLAELSSLIHHLHHECFIENAEFSPEKSREMIMHAVELGLKSPEEVHNHADESRKRMKADALKALDELKSILLGEDE